MNPGEEQNSGSPGPGPEPRPKPPGGTGGGSRRDSDLPVGWRFEADETTMTAACLAAGPIVIHDLHADSRFHASSILVETQLLGGVAAPIPSASGAWGVLYAFVAEVKKLRGKKQPLTAATLAALRDEHTRSIAPARQQATEALHLERTLSDLINQAYDLTPEEVKLMWATAPPRMPL